MKVLYIALGGKGGSDKALVDLLSILVNQYDIEPLVICGRQELRSALEKIGVQSLFYDFEWALCPPSQTLKDKILYLPRYIKQIFKRKKNVVTIAQVAKEFVPALISTNVGVVNLGYSLGKQMGIPHVWHIREYQLLDHDMHYVGGIKHFKRLLEKNKFNIAITKGLYEYFEMLYPAVHIYDGVRNHRTQVSSQPPQNYFIFAGFLYKGKGLDELLPAYKAYCDSGGGCELYILGSWNRENPFHRWIQQYISDNGLKKARLLGFRNDVDELMSRSLAVIVPSRFEAFGRVTCEAMYNKTLVIGKNTAGTKEQFDNLDDYVGKSISFRYQTEEELVDKMFEVEKIGPELRSEIVEKQFELVNELYSNEKSASKVYEYYKTVIELYNNK